MSAIWAGPKLPAGECIPTQPDGDSEESVRGDRIGDKFINSINPEGSTNVGDVVHGFDQATHNNGAGLNQLLTTSSAVLDSPDQAINDIGSIVTNLGQLTSLLRELRDPMKEVMLDAQTARPSIFRPPGRVGSVRRNPHPGQGISDIEQNLGDTIQFTLDEKWFSLRKLSAHAPGLRICSIRAPWINTLANYVNNRELDVITDTDRPCTASARPMELHCATS